MLYWYYNKVLVIQLGAGIMEPSNLTGDYYRAKEKGMKKVKKDKYVFSSAQLKKAQEELKEQKRFKITDENAEEYKEFILKSYRDSSILAKRAEYARTLRD